MPSTVEPTNSQPVVVAPIDSKQAIVELNGKPADDIPPTSSFPEVLTETTTLGPPAPSPVAPLPLPTQHPEEKQPDFSQTTQTLPHHEKVPVQDSEKVKKRQSFITRTLWTFIMIGGFIGTHFSWPFYWTYADFTQVCYSLDMPT